MADTYRIAIVGSGPAGLSAAAHAAKLGISHILLEKTDHLSDTIYKYQKGKHVMATPNQLVLRSDIDFDAGKREKVLGTWDDQTAANKVNVRLKSEVKAITGAKGDFTITLTDKTEIKAENIILAIGTQGNPNLLRCPGADGGHLELQYQLDDPGEYVDEHITVIGAGDAGIENALGLAQDVAQGNIVSIINRTADFSRAKGANVKLLMQARDEGRMNVITDATPNRIEAGHLVLDTRDGEARIRCDRIIARMGSAAPRKFIEECGIQFTSPDREAFPTLSPQFESTNAGIYVIGALAGYPLIKHCMNQGYDVVEFINGNTALKPADEPILEGKFVNLPIKKSVDEWLEFIRTQVKILNDLSPLQMREFMLDSDVRYYGKNDIIFEKNAPGSSLFCIAQGSVDIPLPDGRSTGIVIPEGSIFGEVGLVSGRRRGSTIRSIADTVVVEIPRNAILKLMASVPGVKRAVTRISTERQLLQMWQAGLQPADLAEVLETAEIKAVRAGEAIFKEGEEGNDVYVIRSGSVVVEKSIGGKPVFLSYVPAGNYVGELELFDNGIRKQTVRAAVKSEVIKLGGDAFRRLLEAKPTFFAKAKTAMGEREDLASFIEAKKDSFATVVDMYSSVANFLVDNGVGEATDVLLIDENLCVGCDNCEKACADSHEGISRLDREAGRTFAHLHVPTSCRHCEHPHCMADCPPTAIHRGQDGEVYIDDTCIGCGNCQRNCPYGVIRMEKEPPKKPSLWKWFLFGQGPGPGEPSHEWAYANATPGVEKAKRAVKCDMCSGIEGGPSCVRACPTGAAIRVAPEEFLTVARLQRDDA
ncbi:cyclic nucleotide-binding domain-containing protein [Rhizorhabdus dicambivorans]|uniref:Oxidoreductase n=1 Tax=Rhizorhabdus dicambivorans TaxID=1850238 RepID=A0A2A4G2R9_9SPHN|nr:cyclic nucleotide-binding domain-containing protein [Rhizorhabdus dicambivorans]ATE65044.1 oxidoreductase [Rhizorhabdus dicambivorans]PCE44318.1 oxidoreductase [Rhizorhabdus dicambivorans]